jgi:hypothetical protein
MLQLRHSIFWNNKMANFNIKKLSKLFHDCEGSITLLGLYMFVAGTMIGAFALDYTYLQATKTQLQVAADQASHAALYNRRTMSETDAKKAAIEIIQPLLPRELYGEIITDSSIEFGSYDRDSLKFTFKAGSKEAVRVTASMLAEKSNAAPSYLFHMLGIDHFDIRARATFMTYKPGCLRQGLMADGIVDLQSNNSFTNGFCVHSNTHISINQNNYFESGTVVSMPHISDLDMPRSGFDKNDGLQEALRDQSMHLNIMKRLEDIESGLNSRSGEYVPTYIDKSLGITYIKASTVTQDMLTPYSIHRIDCKGSKLTIDGSGTAIQDIVIITTCPISFTNGSKIADAVIFTTDTTARSITAPQGLQIGRNDECAEGGGAQLVTMGGVSVASKLSMFGGQILAKKDVDFAANADGLQGASIVSSGEINGTSNSNMGFCLSGMEQNFETDYYRMAE